MRFLEVLDELQSRQIVKNDADFCKKTDYSLQSLGKVRKAERNVTIELVSKLCNDFNGNPVYLLRGIGDKIADRNVFLAEEPQSSYNKGNEHLVTINTLEKLVETKDEVIGLLKKDINRLNDELKKRNKLTE